MHPDHIGQLITPASPPWVHRAYRAFRRALRDGEPNYFMEYLVAFSPEAARQRRQPPERRTRRAA